MTEPNILMTSDNHFHHENIIKYCHRPYKNVDEMNERMIENWNKKVRPDDRVLCHGDVSFGDPVQTSLILKRLNGKLELICGNHDESALTSPAREYWTAIHHYLEFDYLDQRTGKKYGFVCFHFPIERNCWHWADKGRIHTCGHRHMPSLREDLALRRFDVGVDANNYAPVSIQEIIDAAESGTWKKPKWNKR